MAAPGVARATPDPQPGLQRTSTYNSQWVNKPVSPVDSLDASMPKIEVTDISQRELGKFYIHPDVASGKYKTEIDRQIAKPVEDREREWKARMGIRNVGDEQAPAQKDKK